MRGLIVLPVFLSLAAGCGANETTTSRPAAQTPTAATSTATEHAATASTGDVDFVASAEAICRRMQRDAQFAGASTPPSDQQVAQFLDKWRSGIEQLAALEPADDRKRQFAQMLVHYRRLLDAIEAMIEAEDETVLVAVAGIAVEGQRGGRAARNAGLDACALFPEIKQPPADPEHLYDATRDLVPPQARVVRDDGLECDTTDSCRIEYELDRSVAARLRAGRSLLRAHGWSNIRGGKTPSGSRWLMANRNDYVATLEFVGEEVPAHCTGRVTWGCSDAVWVSRYEVPDVLTGG